MRLVRLVRKARSSFLALAGVAAISALGPFAGTAQATGGAAADEKTSGAYKSLPHGTEKTKTRTIGIDGVGWTTTAPAGWSVDDSKTPSGDESERRGWSFATDEPGTTRTTPGRDREGNIRARTAHPVSDAGAGRELPSSTARFDSTLISPTYRLHGATKATLRFATDYAGDGPQTGDVHICFDGGEPIPIKSYRANTTTSETLDVTIPTGARTAQVRFRYTGAHHAFWTVERVSFTPTNPIPGLTVTAMTGTSSELGRPDGEGPWWATGTAHVSGTDGKPVPGAWVTAEIRADGQALRHFGLTRRDGSVDFGVPVLWSNDAVVRVTAVRHLTLPYHEDPATSREVRIVRPTT
ncbi:hypothetical protein [Streptomyces sp. SID3343]|uniref:hypothetical protein n=1 Tax=Streptomyces sp. SID3343 TaxID=2690260 RepID=UPI00136C9C29|nr:hypothetical protein [Streptomyces sp. SID3343]MYW03417.1 hypothetical protein [Streptomyces sp. SID3343]